MRWAGHAASMDEIRSTYLGAGEGIIRMKFKINSVFGCGLDSSGSGWKPVAGCCEDGNKPFRSVMGREFLD
jgi:hypothetical protein